jgi:hypothetical protein
MARPASSPANLKTANSADLPPGRPWSWNINNLKTIKTLELTIAPPLLGRADEAIE